MINGKGKRNIVLTGMPGTGKSTVGGILAKEMMRSFIDTDRLIESGEGKKLQEIISLEGMKYFLAIEEKYLVGIDALSVVISTGGSAVYSALAMQKLASTGIIIHLDLGLSDIKKRFACMDERGVARAPGQTIESLYEERRPLYLKHAHITIDCNSLLPSQIKAEILSSIKMLD